MTNICHLWRLECCEKYHIILLDWNNFTLSANQTNFLLISAWNFFWGSSCQHSLFCSSPFCPLSVPQISQLWKDVQHLCFGPPPARNSTPWLLKGRKWYQMNNLYCVFWLNCSFYWKWSCLQKAPNAMRYCHLADKDITILQSWL